MPDYFYADSERGVPLYNQPNSQYFPRYFSILYGQDSGMQMAAATFTRFGLIDQLGIANNASFNLLLNVAGTINIIKTLYIKTSVAGWIELRNTAGVTQVWFYSDSINPTVIDFGMFGTGDMFDSVGTDIRNTTGAACDFKGYVQYSPLIK